MLLYTSLTAPVYARAHSYLDPAMLASYTAPWPVVLASAVVVAGIMMALIPLRRGERWALWTELAVLTLLFVTRLTTDPRCRIVLDPHRHGCHSFMIAVVVGVDRAGAVLAVNY
jgi:hypothetical protein